MFFSQNKCATLIFILRIVFFFATIFSLGLNKKELGVLSQLRDIPQPEFPCPFRIPRCDPGAKYRKADGSCNNLQNPIWGKTGTPLQRFLSPWYDDGNKIFF